MKELLDQYLNYNLWANHALAAALKGFPNGKLDQEVISSFPSLRKTVHHIYDAETIWLNRLQSQKTEGWPSASFEENPPIEFFMIRSGELAQYGLGLDETELSRAIRFFDHQQNPFENTAAEMILHCINHSSFHRGQIVMMLRQLGESNIPRTDMIYFLNSD